MKKTYHSRQLEGILCVDKPQDWTSFDVVAKCGALPIATK